MLTGGEDALAALLGPHPVTTARWGLDRIEALLDQLGRPERTFRALHVAGTNGKGSTASFAASMLAAGGLRTGLYTSPHLSDVRERFLVDGSWIEESVVQSAASRILDCDASDACTYFEVSTALAFLCFAECGVEVTVAETGLGGRLDATNVLRPAGTAITPIGFDHTDLLGSSLRAIAGEKAGIFKRDVPASLGRMDGVALETLERIAARTGSPVARLGREAEVSEVRSEPEGTRFRYVSRARPGGVPLATRLPGRYQADNAALALLMLDRSGYELDEARVRRGVAQTRLPGRFELRREGPAGGTWVFDIAHNPAAAEALCATLAELSPPRPLVAVVGLLADKDWKAVLGRLALDSDHMILTCPAAPECRVWDPAEAQAWMSRKGAGDVTVSVSVAEAVARGRELAGSGTVLVTGSAYTVGEARTQPVVAGTQREERRERHAVRSEIVATDEGRADASGRA
ncbi:bifunctional folylpolyglutamate synthase/dihydrofolate synthase [Candidatus Palauibacter sp.]|uniref:bifunctional folylpolyglutamate synthase/dihydrofolate synthase n=1 Tax=Candidatus Palauibacter sp. TaxID=3101350 RepID=UPI003AF1E838